MKKLYVILVVLLCTISFVDAQEQKFSAGLYVSLSHQCANYVGDADFLKSEGLYLSGGELEMFFRYRLNETFALKLGVAISQNIVPLSDVITSSLYYNEFPVEFSLQTNLFNYSGFSLFIENGLKLAYCDSYRYSQIINPDRDGFVLGGSVGSYSVAESLSCGLLNGIGLSYTFKCNIEIDMFMRYVAGLNKVWENNEIFVMTQDSNQTYTISSYGSTFDLGLGVFYNF